MTFRHAAALAALALAPVTPFVTQPVAAEPNPDPLARAARHLPS